jgi:hypothetical protein
MTLAHVSLLGIALSGESHWHGPAAATRPPAYQYAAFQEGSTVTFQATEPKASGLIKADAVLNLPALFLGEILAGILQWHGDPALMAVSTVFVPLIWFRIGRSVDEQRGTVSGGSKRASKFRFAIRLTLRTAASVFLIVALQGLTPAFRHHTSDTDFLFGTLILWCAAYLVCSFWGQRRLKKRALLAA